VNVMVNSFTFIKSDIITDLVFNWKSE
jgi:hypothetical protein